MADFRIPQEQSPSERPHDEQGDRSLPPNRGDASVPGFNPFPVPYTPIMTDGVPSVSEHQFPPSATNNGPISARSPLVSNYISATDNAPLHSDGADYLAGAGNARIKQVAKGFRNVVREPLSSNAGTLPLSQSLHPGHGGDFSAPTYGSSGMGVEDRHGEDPDELRRKVPSRTLSAEAMVPPLNSSSHSSSTESPNENGSMSQLSASASGSPHLSSYSPRTNGMQYNQYGPPHRGDRGGNMEGIHDNASHAMRRGGGGGAPMYPQQHMYPSGYSDSGAPPPHAAAHSGYAQSQYGGYGHSYEQHYHSHGHAPQAHGPHTAPAPAPGHSSQSYPYSMPPSSSSYPYASNHNFHQAAMHQQTMSHPYYYGMHSSYPPHHIGPDGQRYGYTNPPNASNSAPGSAQPMMPYGGSGYPQSHDHRDAGDRNVVERDSIPYTTHDGMPRIAGMDRGDASSMQRDPHGNQSSAYGRNAYYQNPGDLRIASDRMIYRSKSNDADSVSSETSAPYSSTSSQYSLTPRSGQIPNGYENSPLQSDLSRMHIDGYQQPYMTRPPSLGSLNGASLPRRFPSASDFAYAGMHGHHSGASELDSSIDSSMNASDFNASTNASGTSSMKYNSQHHPSAVDNRKHHNASNGTIMPNASNRGGPNPYAVPMSPIMSNGVPLNRGGSSGESNRGSEAAAQSYSNSAMHMLPRSHLNLQLNSSNAYGMNQQQQSISGGGSRVSGGSVASTNTSASAANSMGAPPPPPPPPPHVAPITPHVIGSLRSQRRKRIKMSNNRMLPKGISQAGVSWRIQVQVVPTNIRMPRKYRFSRNVPDRESALWLYEVAILFSDKPRTLGDQTSSGNYNIMLEEGLFSNAREYYTLLGRRVRLFAETESVENSEVALAVMAYDQMVGPDGFSRASMGQSCLDYDINEMPAGSRAGNTNARMATHNSNGELNAIPSANSSLYREEFMASQRSKISAPSNRRAARAVTDDERDEDDRSTGSSSENSRGTSSSHSSTGDPNSAQLEYLIPTVVPHNSHRSKHAHVRNDMNALVGSEVESKEDSVIATTVPIATAAAALDGATTTAEEHGGIDAKCDTPDAVIKEGTSTDSNKEEEEEEDDDNAEEEEEETESDDDDSNLDSAALNSTSTSNSTRGGRGRGRGRGRRGRMG